MLRILVLFFTLLHIDAHAALDNEIILKAKKGVVSLENRVRESAYEEVFSKRGTGFLVDKKNGILITNQHLASQADVNDIEITFYNGKSLDATFIYNDPTIDFSFIKVNPKEIPDVATEIKLTDSKVSNGDNVFIIGNNEARDFSIQTGIITNKYDFVGYFPAQILGISLNTKGGSSGSPVFNEGGEAIALNFAGSNTSANAIPATYIISALKEIQKGKRPIRRDTGILINYYSLDDAAKFKKFPKSLINEYIKKYPDSLNKILVVSRIINDTPAENKLEPGDIIMKINGREIGPELHLMQRIIDNNETVEFEVFRRGKKKVVKVSTYKLNDSKIKRMVSFNGATFFECDNFIRLITGAPLHSVFVSNTSAGSEFKKLPFFHTRDYEFRAVQIVQIGDKRINNLDDLIKVIPGLVKEKYFTVNFKNYGMKILRYNSTPHFARTTYQLDVTYNKFLKEPTYYTYNDKLLKWEDRQILPSK